jgi:hypothetical protein
VFLTAFFQLFNPCNTFQKYNNFRTEAREINTGLGYMAAPNDVQQAVLKKMSGYRIIMQWTQGALMIAPDRHYKYTKVIDTDGQVYALSHYLAMREYSSKRRVHPFLCPCAGDA